MTAHYVIENGSPSVATLVNIEVIRLELADLPVAAPAPAVPSALSAARWPGRRCGDRPILLFPHYADCSYFFRAFFR